MQRRVLLKTLTALTLGSTLSWGCSNKDQIWEEGLSKISIDEQSARFINQLSQVILPTSDIDYSTPESLPQFIETLINDCHSAEDISKYGRGYQEYKIFLKEKLSADIAKLEEDELNELFDAVNDETLMTENGRFFFNKTREISIEHFKSSEYYLTNFTNYEMVPARFNGCANLN